MKILGDPPSPPKALIFLLLVVWMVLSGTHLLETAYHVSTFRAVGDSSAARDAVPWLRGSPSGAPGVVYLVYRHAIALAFLILSYHGLAFREWARKALVGLLAFDLCAWLVHSLAFLAFPSAIQMSREEILLQVGVAVFEGILVWLLTLPATVGHFATGGKKSKMPA
ncbi:MAG: hypothetical protein HUU16_09455 [Candidatus Omnitrophica bacterium]|nr:hypothetical protein [bacterium]NUN96387.1 hypothetical protein [Candidatus Omnitrophota bacterium]